MVRRIPFLIVAVAGVGLGCTAITFRPTYRPFPLAAFDTVTAKPPDIITAAAAEATLLGLEVRVSTPAEGYLETRWFDLVSRRSRSAVANPDQTTRVRVWADLVTPLQSQVVIEAAQRRSLDPSVPEREDEIVAAAGTPADSIVQSLREAIRQHFKASGEPGAGSRGRPRQNGSRLTAPRSRFHIPET